MKYFWLINDIGAYIHLEAGSLYECIRDKKLQMCRYLWKFIQIMALEVYFS
jgi:hypothetical protein